MSRGARRQARSPHISHKLTTNESVATATTTMPAICHSSLEKLEAALGSACERGPLSEERVELMLCSSTELTRLSERRPLLNA